VSLHVSNLPTLSTSESSTRSSIPTIPVLPLPHLPASTLLPSANLFSNSAISAAPGLTSTPKQKPLDSAAGLSDPFVLEEKKDSKGKVIRPGSVEDRKQAMMDRIKARSGSSKTPLPTLGSSFGSFKKANLSAAAQQEELKRRSTLSRLEGIAEGVWMWVWPILGVFCLLLILEQACRCQVELADLKPQDVLCPLTRAEHIADTTARKAKSDPDGGGRGCHSQKLQDAHLFG
jgi:hypothetical protein